MKTLRNLLMALLLCSAAGSSQAQVIPVASPSLGIGARLDIRDAVFVWDTEGEDATVIGWVVQCGKDTHAYDRQSQLLPLARLSYQVSDLLNSNGTYYCIVGGFDGKVLVTISNEVVLIVKGRNVIY